MTEDALDAEVARTAAERLTTSDTPCPNAHATLAYRHNLTDPEVHLTRGDAREYVRQINQVLVRNETRAGPSDAALLAVLIIGEIAVLIALTISPIFFLFGQLALFAVLFIVVAIIVGARKRANGNIRRQRLADMESLVQEWAVPLHSPTGTLRLLSEDAGVSVLRSAVDQVTPDLRDSMVSSVESGNPEAAEQILGNILASEAEHKVRGRA